MAGLFASIKSFVSQRVDTLPFDILEPRPLGEGSASIWTLHDGRMKVRARVAVSGCALPQSG